MTFCATLLGCLAALFTLALAYDLHRRARPARATAPEDAHRRMLRSCLKALRDTDMLDAWSDVPPAIWRDPQARAAAAKAIKAYVQRPACPIARADCMACLSGLARHV